MRLASLVSLTALGVLGSSAAMLLEARAGGSGVQEGADPFPHDATFTTVITAPRSTYGIAADSRGLLYVSARGIDAGQEAHVYRIDPEHPSLVLVGRIPAASDSVRCAPSGIALDGSGNVFVADTISRRVFRFTPNAAAPPTATVFARDLAGAQAIAFDSTGALWGTDGLTNEGVVWRIPPGGGAAEEKFRIPPLKNGEKVGREVTRYPVGPGLTPAAGLSVGTGIACEQDGKHLLVSDITRGAIWRVEFKADGTITSPMGNDTTYTANTLDLSNVLLSHPIITGVGQMALDRAGNIWVAVPDRNAIAVVTKDGKVNEIFRNPVHPVTKLRNSAATAAGNKRILEFPTMAVLVGHRLYVANFDSDIGDNSPNSGGELGVEDSSGRRLRGKISVMDQPLRTPGMLLPVRGDGGQ